MANHASALKAHRQSLRRRLRNRSNRSRLRTALNKFSELLNTGKVAEARQSLPSLYSLVDKSIQKKALSENAAARQKSRLTRRLSQAEAGANKG
ncbi:MAG: 30S ribosomal protein S20 [Acidobacteria bacterium]|nr:MAG: 30S ribosomal protein S20 [Acidobacteriota bacterium]PYU99979.1 MAG: 30S ribosomal protein S20 [Acidobacteriota bacterium]